MSKWHIHVPGMDTITLKADRATADGDGSMIYLYKDNGAGGLEVVGLVTPGPGVVVKKVDE